MGHAVAQLLEALRYKSEGSGYEYQQYFLGVKTAGA